MRSTLSNKRRRLINDDDGEDSLPTIQDESSISSGHTVILKHKN